MRRKITILMLFAFSCLLHAQVPTAKIQSYLNENYAKLEVSLADVQDWIVESEANSDATGITNYYIKQRHQGIELFHAQTNFSIKNGEVF
ncbi:hypothetical protein, partial [Flavobacterium filum]